MKTGVLILAAGAASRMKLAKMLLPFGESNILASIVEEVKAIKPANICLVTGYHHEAIKKSIPELDLNILFNAQWQEGMSVSIKLGMASLLQKDPELDSVMILVSDQPYINREFLRTMITESADRGKGIVAAQYEGINGTPVLFSKAYFKDLQKLTGDKGARVILQAHQEDVATLDFPMGALDIDTPEDYEMLCRKIKEQDAER